MTTATFELSEMRAAAGQACSLLKALANPDRLTDPVPALAGREACRRSWRRCSGIVQPTLSQQLTVLREQQLVSTRRDGKNIYLHAEQRPGAGGDQDPLRTVLRGRRPPHEQNARTSDKDPHDHRLDPLHALGVAGRRRPAGHRLGPLHPGQRPHPGHQRHPGRTARRRERGDAGWRIAFLLGMLAAPPRWRSWRPRASSAHRASMPATARIVVAGLLVGFGTRYGSGCTSGHGVCGLSRLSPRSLVATGPSWPPASPTVFVIRHLF